MMTVVIPPKPAPPEMVKVKIIFAPKPAPEMVTMPVRIKPSPKDRI